MIEGLLNTMLEISYLMFTFVSCKEVIKCMLQVNERIRATVFCKIKDFNQLQRFKFCFYIQLTKSISKGSKIEIRLDTYLISLKINSSEKEGAPI